MNASERRVADVLDSLHVHWEYEPTEFVLELKEDGNTKHAFRPDFYLPKQDLYIEVTMARDRYLKNHKLRAMRDAFPDVQTHLVARADFKDLRTRVCAILSDHPQPTSP